MSGRHRAAGTQQRTWDRLRTLFSAPKTPAPHNPQTDLFDHHTGADDTMATTRFLDELTDRRTDEQELGAAAEYDTIDRLRELAYGPEGMQSLRGLPGEDWEYAIYRWEPSERLWAFVRFGPYRMEHQPLKSALSPAEWPDDVAGRIRQDWLDWHAEYIRPEERPRYACLVRREGTDMWLGRHLGGEL